MGRNDSFVPLAPGRSDLFVNTLPSTVETSPELSGSGSPEGAVPGMAGQTFVNIDNNDLYIKISGVQAVGWKLIGKKPVPVVNISFQAQNNGATYVSKSGSDATGQRGNIGLPYLTLTAAKNGAVSGDTIVVFPGTYVENNLLKDGVNWHFYPGAIVSYTMTSQKFTSDGFNTRIGDNITTPATNSAILGIFDDSVIGACTCSIDGYGDFRIQNNGFGKNLGTVVVTNPGTILNVRCKRIGYAYYSDAFLQGLAAVYVRNSTFVTITCEEVYSTNPVGSQFDTGTKDFDSLEVFWNGGGSGIYWEFGQTHCDVKVVRLMDLYCVGGNNTDGSSTNADFYIRSEVLEGHCYTSGGNGSTNEWRSWWYIGQAMNGFGFYQSGKHYVYIEKMLHSSFAFTQLGGSKVWITCQKMTALGNTTLNWINLTGDGSGNPTLYADIQHMEDLNPTGFSSGGGVVIGAGCTMHLKNAWATLRSGNNNPMVLMTGAATVRLTNCTIDASPNNNAAANPIKVAGAGMVVDKCVLRASASADSITSVAAQTVTCYKTVTNKAKNANITVNVDQLTVDVNVV